MVPVVFPDSTSMWLFGLAALALLAIPGPAVLYIVFQSAEQGRRVGLASVAGVHLGTLVHVAAASAGLSALIVASSLAFGVVKYAGAAYLVYLGIRKLLEREEETRVEHKREPLRRAFVRGTIVNALNPKTALFFLAFLPQFVAPDRGGVWSQALVLGFVFAGLDDHPDLPAGLERVDLLDTGLLRRELLEGLEPLDVVLEALTACAGSGRRDRIGRDQEHGLDGLRLDLVVMRLDRVDDVLRLAVTTCTLRGDRKSVV